MSKFLLTYKPYGKSAVLIEWPSIISVEILMDIKIFKSTIQKINSKEILDINFVYNSLLVVYNPLVISYSNLKTKLTSIYNQPSKSLKTKTIKWEIPICYDENLGLDLPLLSQEKGLSINQIISLHSESTYTVFGIGFLPGFLYLGGLKSELHFDRRKTPRPTVFKGAVAIGGSQTGIYPQNSPGGWHIIGKTPINLFNATNKKPCIIEAGDQIVFKPISFQLFNDIENQLKLGEFQLKRICHD